MTRKRSRFQVEKKSDKSQTGRKIFVKDTSDKDYYPKSTNNS